MDRESPRSPAPGEFVALEGAYLVERALASGLGIDRLFFVPAREAWAKALPERGYRGKIAEMTQLPEAEIAGIAGYPFHRGAYAMARRPLARGLDECLDLARGGGGRLETILVLPELGDPENLGAAFRNAAALGCDALLLGPTGPDPFCRRVLRVSMGCSLSLPWARLGTPGELAGLASRGFTSAACVLDGSAEDIRGWKRPERLSLVMGNEAFGLSAPWLDACSRRVTLPMLGGVDSLNLATAAAVFLYALSANGGEASIAGPA